ncbi:MAG: GtrA family protein [Actinomycetota bacterium]|nr:GtrA family protein [Actinomycetota bacterium]
MRAPRGSDTGRFAGFGRFGRFAVIGAVNTATYLLIYLLLRLVLPYLVAHVCAFGVAMVGSYFLNCRYTFGVRPSWRTFGLFPLSNAANVVVSTVGLYALVQWVEVDERVAGLLAATLAIPVTFLVAQLVLVGSHR